MCEQTIEFELLRSIKLTVNEKIKHAMRSLMWWDNRCLSGHVNNSMLKQLWGLPQIFLLLCSR